MSGGKTDALESPKLEDSTHALQIVIHKPLRVMDEDRSRALDLNVQIQIQSTPSTSNVNPITSRCIETAD